MLSTKTNLEITEYHEKFIFSGFHCVSWPVLVSLPCWP